MNYIDIVIRQILDNFDFAYMLCCNILCFVMIKTHDEFNGAKKVPTWNKRLYLIVSILLLGIVYYNVGEVKVTVLVNSAMLMYFGVGLLLQYFVNLELSINK